MKRYPTLTPAQRVTTARRAVVTVGDLDGNTRVLLAAAEAADAVVARAFAANVACVVADKCGHAVAELSTVRGMQTAVRDAIEGAGLAGVVSQRTIANLVWRLVFDMWGGPDR